MNLIAPLLSLCLLAPCCAAQDKKEETPKPAQSIAELRQQLEKILQETHTPGVSLAIVHSDGPEWVGGVGKSDVASNRPVTDETLFRIGSTSKAFVSLSVLKLAQEGKLSLLDPVHKLVPEICGLARWSVGLRGRSALRARHVAGGRALDLGWRNPVAAMWAGRGERCSHLFKVDLLAGGHSGDSTA
jgi:CubicO group peptidase (beta-lactamase class C family)